jgi:UDP-N-acetylglucosamine:LPS N-acetylglucosamine transferase
MNNPQMLSDMSAAARKFFIPDAAAKLAGVILSIGIEHGS